MPTTCPLQTQADDMLHRMASDSPPTRAEVERLLVVAARHTSVRLEEGSRIMAEQTKCLGELRGSHVHMQGELRDLREVVMTKHAREIDALKADLAALRAEQEASQARLKYWLAGASAVFVVLSNINLAKLAELVR